MSLLRLDDAIHDQVLLGVVRFSGLSVSEENPFWEEIEQLGETHRRAWSGKAPSEIPGLEPARRLYRTFGVDPTRIRPSSEALLRRTLKGEPLYRINRLVDACNWASLALLLPIGLYDLARVRGNMVVRVGRSGEEYEGIRKGPVHVAGRLTVADDEGPFGSPTSDSARTSVSTGTTEALAVVFAPGDFPRLALEQGLQRFAGQVMRWCGGRDEEAWLLGGAGA
jgi:DNA/RNA-binding domain of Phe-tRNA-synthetase-like protein